MDTVSDRKKMWRSILGGAIARIAAGEKMLNDRRRKLRGAERSVIFHGVYSSRRDIEVALDGLGGMAGVW